jgi:hypothetical protein
MANRKTGTRPEKEERFPEKAEQPVFLLLSLSPKYLSDGTSGETVRVAARSLCNHQVC